MSNNYSELQFLIYGQVLRFGLIEFRLIRGLNFGQYPSHVALTQMSSSTRLRETYMDRHVYLKLADLEEAFLS